jgi:hypothetical protein
MTNPVSYSTYRRSQADDSTSTLLLLYSEFTAGDEDGDLCPFCDRPLIRPHSERLKKALDIARRNCPLLPTETNPFGRAFNTMAQVALCSVHNAEDTAVLGKSQQWPQEMAWDKVLERVKAMGEVIRLIIEDNGDPISPPVAGEPHISLPNRVHKDGPRMRCTFWTDFMEQAEEVGLWAVTSIANQQKSFAREQPG